MREAIGMVEVKGLVASIEVSDAMVKAANVQLRDLDITKGVGWVLVTVTGNVGAVNAAVDQGERVAKVKDSFVSAKVIPRPIDDLFKEDKQVEKKNLKPKASKIEKEADKKPAVNKQTMAEKQTKKPKETQKVSPSKKEQKGQAATEDNRSIKKSSKKATKKTDTKGSATNKKKTNTKRTLGGQDNE